MPSHESHGLRGPGHGFSLGHGHRKMGGPLRFFAVNAIITQIFARVWMVVSAIALMKIASSLALGARVKLMDDLRDDLSQEQRDALLDDIWRRARRKRLSNCPVMPSCCSPKAPSEK